jgi:hypothetical protein
MGVIVGKKSLVEARERFLNYNKNVIRGIEGEISVANLLEKYLPSDTFIISHPEIGKFEPDFLIISPRYGFRIIEVKNWNIGYIDKVQSNGKYTINNRSANPLVQVRKHVDDLNHYLSSSYQYTCFRWNIIDYQFN